MSLPPRVDQGYAQQGTSLSNIPSRRHSKTNSRSSDSNINGNGADIQNNSQNAQNINTVNLPKSGSASTTGGGSTDFVKKLFTMLEDNSYKDIVRWTISGDSFVVVDTNEFTKEILPRHFKHSNFASFVRQLNKYDFHKVKVSNDEKQNNIYGETAWEFKHPDFRVNSRDSLDNIKRKGPTQKKINEDHSQELLNNLQNEVKTLKAQNKQMNEKLKNLSSDYKNVVDSLIQMKNANDQYDDTLKLIMKQMSVHGIPVPTPSEADLRSVSQLPNLQLPSLNVGNSIQPPAGPQNLVQQSQPDSLVQTPVGIQDPMMSLTTGHQQNGSNGGMYQPIGTQVGSGIVVAAAAAAAAQQSAPQVLGPEILTNQPGTSTVTATSNDISNIISGVPPSNFHVLLVEDDQVCIQLCRQFLMKYGCTVEVVSDGLSAISLVEKVKYDLVLMDIVMPNLDGASATSIIRSFDRTTPIIAMTGNIQDADLVAYLQHGMSDLLAKPFSKGDLYSILEKYLIKRKIIQNSEQNGQTSSTTSSGSISSLQVPATLAIPTSLTQTVTSGTGLTPMGSVVTQTLEPQTDDIAIKKQRTN